MLYNKYFNDFLLDLILEDNKQNSVKELPFLLSDRLRGLLQRIKDKHAHENKIATDLLSINYNKKSKKMTLIDYDNDDYNKFTFINSNKYYDYKKDKGMDHTEIQNYLFSTKSLSNKEDWRVNRSSIKIGRFIMKLFKDEYDNKEVEQFVNLVKSERKLIENALDRIQIVDGEDIKKYYFEENYSEESSDYSPLGKSCMKYDDCQEYINFYSINKGVKLVILMSDDEEDKILGRALLWDINRINGVKVDRKFLDRVYYTYEEDVNIFHQYAIKNNWLYKYYQNMDNDVLIYDPEKNDKEYLELKTTHNFIRSTHDEYPYMDTMKFFNVDAGFLTNSESIGLEYPGDVYFLEDTGGGYEILNEGIWSDYYGEYISEDDAVYCELGDDIRLPEDAIFIEQVGEYATQDYVDNEMFYYDYHNEYYFLDDAVYSDAKDEYVPYDFAVEVYRDADYETVNDLIDNEDVLIYDKNYDQDDYFYYFSRDIEKELYFDKHLCGMHFVDVKLNDSKNSSALEKMHKVWDKDRYFKWKGKYYADIGDLKDKITGQKRLWDNN